MAIRVRHEPAAVGLALASDLVGRGELAKERQKLLEQRRQYEEKLAEEQRQFDEGTRRFDVGQEFQERQFGEGTRRFDLGHGLDVAEFGEGRRQFNVSQWLAEQNFLEGQRQYNLGLQENYAQQAQDMQKLAMQQQGYNFREMVGQAGQDRRLGMINQQNIDAEMRQQAKAQQNWQQQRIAGRMDSDWQAIQNNRRFWTEDQYDNAVEGFQNKYANAGEPMPFDPPYTPPPGQAQLDGMLNSDDPALRQIGALSQLTPDGNSTMLIPGASEIFKIQAEERNTERRDKDKREDHEKKTMEGYRLRSEDRRVRAEGDRRKREQFYRQHAPKPPEPRVTPGKPGVSATTVEQPTQEEIDLYRERMEDYNEQARDSQVEAENWYKLEEVRDCENFAAAYPERTFSSTADMVEARKSGAIGPGELVMVRDVATDVIEDPGPDELYGTADDKTSTKLTARYIRLP